MEAMTNSAWEALSDKEYRDAFAEGLVDDRLSAQIYYLRTHRGWTQLQLAEKSGLTQPTISNLEDSTDGVRLSTLRKLASAFDVALDARVASFSGLLRAFDAASLNSHIPSYSEDAPPFRATVVRVSTFISPSLNAKSARLTTSSTPSFGEAQVRSRSSNSKFGVSAHG